jgi:hypothetical protein
MTPTVPKETPRHDYGDDSECKRCGAYGPLDDAQPCERETLQAWAERTALTLDETTLRGIVSNTDWDERTLSWPQVDAIKRVLDRIAGELTPRRLAYLQSAKECDSLYSYKFRGKVRTEMVAAGLVYRLPPPGASCYAPTPLGRAVLARTEGRR